MDPSQPAAIRRAPDPVGVMLERST